jgi:hypothetical protein
MWWLKLRHRPDIVAAPHRADTTFVVASGFVTSMLNAPAGSDVVPPTTYHALAVVGLR